MNNKVQNFKTIVKTDKQLLIDAGFKESVIRGWIYTNRLPNEENAKKIAAILGLPLSDIPYYRTEHVI